VNFFFPMLASNHDSSDLSLECVAGMTGVCHCDQVLVEMRSWKLFTLAGLEA
jgi:hypothetical protein